MASQTIANVSRAAIVQFGVEPTHDHDEKCSLVRRGLDVDRKQITEFSISTQLKSGEDGLMNRCAFGGNGRWCAKAMRKTERSVAPNFFVEGLSALSVAVQR